ncbi:response regulator transcription factor [Paenibacillus phoenicis]|uniref:Response regulator transcription factor n=1 Tax=Paenibacillus phoenicis TaxID=554117 RepID=A0ABU5PL82_9BACL|nr:response regulator transcription factor [Paenibacillus phoenicis]MEA3570688.1 response regulator transcription factor [Paenibacillus phoenicis]
MGAKILIIDDDKTISTMIRRGFTYEGYEVTVANGGKEGLNLVLEDEPDLIILDIMMPDLDGLEVCKRLRKDAGIPILMVTGMDSIADRVHGLETGADDYLVKPFAFEELVARVKALLRRLDHQKKEDEKLIFSDLVLDLSTRQAFRGSRTIEFSTTEFNLLCFFMKHPQQVLTRELLMERVWGFDFRGESNVLEVYVGYLRSKLEAQNEPRLIHTVRGAGYVLRE